MKSTFLFLHAIVLADQRNQENKPAIDGNIEFGEIALLEFGLSRDNYSCPDNDLGSLCDTDCRFDYAACRSDCSEIVCENECVIIYGQCLSDCPCGVNCPNGCQGCEHPLCEISPCEDLENNEEFIRCESINQDELNSCLSACLGSQIECYEECTNEFLESMTKCPCYEGCQLGCPFCAEFECLLDTYFTAIYLFSSESSTYSEIYSTDGNFKETAVYSTNSVEPGVSAEYAGITYVFSGYSVYKVQDCSLVQLSTTLINLVYTETSFVSRPSYGVYLCFRGSSSYNWCQLFSGSSVRMIDYLANRDKEYACMALYDGKPAAIGGDGGYYVEYLGSSAWYDIGEHPSDTRYANCLTVDSKMVTIGGNDSRKIYQYRSSYWRYLGELKLSHYRGTTIFVDGFIMSVAGSGTKQIERIKLESNDSFSSIVIETIIQNTGNTYRRPVLMNTLNHECLV